MQSYSAYLFDLDGTLIDTAPDLNAALNYALKSANLSPVDETLTRHWVGHGAKVMLQQALAYQHRDAPEEFVEQLFHEFLGFYEANPSALSQPYPHVIETLQALKDRGAKLAVVTNKLARLSELVLDGLHMRDYFSALVGGDSAEFPKPNPAPIHLCLTQIKAPSQETLFVGDSITDANAAINAQIDLALFKHGYNHGEDVSLMGANHLIDSFADLL